MSGSRKEQGLSALATTGVVAILRTDQPCHMTEILDALAEGGVRHFELTMTIPGALDIMTTLRSHNPGMFIGMGTVLDAVTARLAILAGADYVVSPCYDRATVDICRQYNVAVMPGALTPTEVASAWNAGADVVKLFPGRIATPEYLADLKGPLPHIKMMPTTQMTPETAAAYIRAGAIAIGVGSKILDTGAIAERRFEIITEKARSYCTAVAPEIQARR